LYFSRQDERFGPSFSRLRCASLVFFAGVLGVQVTKAAQKGVERVHRECFRCSQAEVLLLDLSQPWSRDHGKTLLLNRLKRQDRISASKPRPDPAAVRPSYLHSVPAPGR
jgi:hypothetical protein